jgi:tetratricopeptide (TPR) repeat protein
MAPMQTTTTDTRRRTPALDGLAGTPRTALRMLVVAALAAAGLAPPAAAQEQPSGAEPAVSNRELARQRYEAGSAAFEAGDYPTARRELEESYRLFASLRTLYSLGLCQQKLGDYAAGVRSLEQYLLEAGADAPPELRTQAEQLISQMRAEMGRLEIAVNVDGADVLVDGTRAGVSPLVSPVDVGPGWHVVEARREGYEGTPQRANVTTGATAAVAVSLTEVAGTGAGTGAGTVAGAGTGTGTGAGAGTGTGAEPTGGMSEQEWYGISDSDYQDYVFSTGRNQPLANWILERNRENPDLTLAEILAGSQGPAWLLAGTLVYVRYEHDFEKNGDDLPWFSFFEWMLGSALTLGAIVMAIIDVMDIGEVVVAHPERLMATPEGVRPASAVDESVRVAADEAPVVDLSLGFGGLMLRF